jgi:hypothetical protein
MDAPDMAGKFRNRRRRTPCGSQHNSFFEMSVCPPLRSQAELGHPLTDRLVEIILVLESNKA